MHSFAHSSMIMASLPFLPHTRLLCHAFAFASSTFSAFAPASLTHTHSHLPFLIYLHIYLNRQSRNSSHSASLHCTLHFASLLFALCTLHSITLFLCLIKDNALARLPASSVALVLLFLAFALRALIPSSLLFPLPCIYQGCRRPLALFSFYSFLFTLALLSSIPRSIYRFITLSISLFPSRAC